MSQNIISAQIGTNQFNEILASIAALREQLPFLIDLSAEQRRNLAKMGDRSQLFVDRALDVAKNHSDILPRRFDLDEFERDVVLAARLTQLKNALIPLSDMLDDSALAAGSDAYAQALEVYAYAKAAGTGDGLDELRRAMSRRFTSTRSATNAEPATESANAV